MSNRRLREKAQRKKVRMWEIAKCFGVADATFSRWLRSEFPQERMKQALQFVDEIAANRQQEG